MHQSQTPIDEIARRDLSELYNQLFEEEIFKNNPLIRNRRREIFLTPENLKIFLKARFESFRERRRPSLPLILVGDPGDAEAVHHSLITLGYWMSPNISSTDRKQLEEALALA